jgi:hypothetical protein
MGPLTYDASVSDSLREFFIVFLPFLIVWTICVIQAGRIAIKRSRDYQRWVVYAVLFGPFAIAALLILPKREYGDGLDDNGWPKRRRSRRRRSSSRS